MSDKQIATPCKYCGFAQYEYVEDTTGGRQSQTGCMVGRLEKYRDKGLITECYDDNAEFSVINTVCMGYRKAEWMMAHKDNWEEKFKDETRVRVDLLVPVGNDRLYDIKTLIQDSQGQFEKIIIVNLNGRNNLYQEQLSKLIRETCKVPYVLECCLSPKTVAEGIDLVIKLKRLNSPYYMLCRPGFVVRENAVESINKLVNEHLEEFLVIEDPNVEDEYNGLLFNRVAHQKLGGNEETSLYSKIQDLCVQQNKSMIRALPLVSTL